MDDSDRATDYEIRHTEAAIAAARRPTMTLLPVGECYYCGALLGRGHLFCDADCRDDYDKEHRLR